MIPRAKKLTDGLERWDGKDFFNQGRKSLAKFDALLALLADSDFTIINDVAPVRVGDRMTLNLAVSCDRISYAALETLVKMGARR